MEIKERDQGDYMGETAAEEWKGNVILFLISDWHCEKLDFNFSITAN